MLNPICCFAQLTLRQRPLECHLRFYDRGKTQLHLILTESRMFIDSQSSSLLQLGICLSYWFDYGVSPLIDRDTAAGQLY